ncbi:MAG: hypothetical protein R6U95_01465 [Bacteroidales bacterium]
MKHSFITAHSIFFIAVCSIFYGIYSQYTLSFSFSVGFYSIVFMAIIHFASGLGIAYAHKNERKKILQSIFIHTSKFILSLAYVVTMLFIYSHVKFQLGIFLAILFLLYMIFEIGIIIYFSAQKN